MRMAMATGSGQGDNKKEKARFSLVSLLETAVSLLSRIWR